MVTKIEKCVVCAKDVKTTYNYSWWKRITNWFFPPQPQDVICASCSFDRAMKIK